MSRLDKHAEVIGASLPEMAFRPIGRHMTLEGGGGGGTTKSTTVTTPLPEYAQPYFEDVMGRAQQASLTPYQQYSGQRVAGLTPAQQTAARLTTQTALGGTPSGLQSGQAASELAASKLAGFSYAPTSFDPSTIDYQYTPGQFDPAQFQYAYDPTQITAERVAAERLGQQLDVSDLATLERFMSPYQQGVVDVEKQAAMRDYQLAQQQRAAQSIGAGAFGGSRQAVLEAEAQRGLMSQMQGIQTRGSQSAFENAQRALEAQRAVELQVGTTNLQSALQAALANQQAGLEAQRGTEASRQFGAQTGLQATLANQQAFMDAQRQAELSRQFGAQTGLQAALANQQASLEAQRMAEMSRQFGASSALQAASALGGVGTDLARMGEAEQNLALARSQALSAVGQQQQDFAQRQLDQAYADYAAARDYEQSMINWYTSVLYGQPTSVSSTVYQPAPSTASQLGGLGLAGLGLWGQTQKG